MPSLISRMRRGSEGKQVDDSPSVRGGHGKRLSVDAGQMDQNGNGNGSPKSSKFKTIFAKHDDNDGGKLDALRKKLTSPSTIFKAQPQQVDRPITPPADVSPHGTPMGRYNDLSPRTPPRTSDADQNRFPSPATSPQQFALSRSRSPENGGTSWTPSYPLVVPDDSYADISPDGQSLSPNAPSPIPKTNENSKRRSIHLDTSKPLSEWQPIQPDRPKPLHISPQSGLPTPPTSTESREEIQIRRSTESGRPVLNVETASKPSPLAQNSEPLSMIRSESSNTQTPTPLSPAITNGITSPPKPVRQRTNLITSPPMPQPIKNLPTLQGWSGFPPSSPQTPRTPGWGSLAREGGPRTPGGMMSPARTPGLGSGGFPFMAMPLPRQTSKGPMSDGELRKAKRAMPVMLREPSFKPPVNPSEDGEVGASDDDEDDDEESETEVEGGHEHGDSEDETETEGKGKGKGKGKNKAVPLRQRLTGTGPAAKGKGKQKTAASPGAGIAPVTEEPDQPSSSMWSLPTPNKEKGSSSIWARFNPGTPGTPSFSRPETNDNTRSNSYRTESDSTDSYFGSQPGSSLNVTTASLPLNNVQPLNRASNADEGEAALEATVPPVVEIEDPNESDGDRASNETSSSHDHSSMAPASPLPAPAAQLPESPQRPTIFTQASQSMVNLASPRRASDAGFQTPKPIQIERENAPGKIDIPKPKFGGVPATPTGEWAKPPPTPAAGFGGMFWSRKEGDKPALKRRRSLGDKGDMEVVLPDYSPALPGVYIPRPRDEEGREKLPAYWCAVHIEGTLSRKQEFTAPGVQARDRSWKKHYFILRGTALFVYKFDPHRFPLKSDNAIVPTTTESESEENLHVHLPGERRLSQPTILGANGARRGSLDATPTPTPARRGSIVNPVGGERRGSISGVIAAATDHRRGSLPGPSPLSTGAEHARRPSGSSAAPSTSTTTSSDAKDVHLFNAPRKASVSSSIGSASSQSTSIASHFQQNQLIKVYTLQNAESGLAADYVKRKNVVRVRSEGEQFLLQTDSARDVVDWIEAFQSATNVALDLDDRPMPKIITLPRRRRRRVAGAAGTTGTGAVGSAAVNASDVAPPSAADTPEGNAAAVAAAERASRDMDRMLGEDQAQGAERT